MDDIKRPVRPAPAPQPVQAAHPPTPPVLSDSNPVSLANVPEIPTTLPRKNRRVRWLIIALCIVTVLVLAGAGAALLWYKDALQPKAGSASRVRVTVVSGQSPEAIGNTLQAQGVIKSSFAFQVYVKQQGKSGQLKAGTYLLSPAQQVPELVQWLVDGKIDSYNVVILPGQTLRDIKAKLVRDGFEASAIDAAFAKTYTHPLLKFKPPQVNLEGYIFPETYQITSETTPEQLLTRAFDEFYTRIQEKGLEAKLAAHSLNLHQAITLASVVQLEVSNDRDRRQVAQVFELRLRQGMMLGSDITFIYAAKQLGITPTPSIDSQYNTRKYKGLPPGAVANFTLSSLEAVADPAPGDYLYFVAGDDGTTHFGRTEQEHTQNINRYCTKLCN